MRQNSQIGLLNELQELLDEQNDLARQGKLSGVENLCERTNEIVEEFSRSGMLKSGKFLAEIKRLEKAYRSLMLTLTNQRDEIGKELDRIRKGRKTIGVYRDSIQIPGK